MKLVSVIGTRPQYIKVKPFYDFCRERAIDHKIIDTQQHYSYEVSRAIIDDLGLTIDYSLQTKSCGEIPFLANSLLQIEEVMKKENPDFVLIYGDTNSTLVAALVCYKMKIPFAHVEANLRCGDINVPEEVNRVFADLTSSIRFCSTAKSVLGPGDVLTGDLEYEILNKFNPQIEYQDYGVMTIHRQANTTNYRLNQIFDFCAKIPFKIVFPVHHRVLPIIKGLSIPSNIEIRKSIPYTEMTENLAKAAFIITDSGGINKTAPFFGKKALIVRKNTEWTETEEAGYARKCNFSEEDLRWLTQPMYKRDKRFYLTTADPSCILYETILRYVNNRKIPNGG